MKLKVISTVIVLIGFCGVTFGIVHVTKSSKKASAIPVGSTFAVAKSHSQGTRPACLSKNANAETAVRGDDNKIGGNYSAFDLATTMGIDTIPAGTHVDAYIHSYDGKTVTGSIAYPSKYGNYNFVIIPSTKNKPYAQWTMTSLIACQKN